jgi:hypothetical protein
VDGVRVPGDLYPARSQFCTESYRPRTRCKRCLGDVCNQIAGLRGRDHHRAGQRLPLAVDRREDLATAGIDDRHHHSPRRRFRDSAGQRIKGADSGRAKSETRAQAARGGDPDPQPGEGTRPEPDGEQVDLFPAAGRGRRGIERGKKADPVQGPAVGAGADQRLEQNLAVTPGAGGGIGGGGVEADYDQTAATA